MRTRRRCGWVFLMVLLASPWAGAQVPNEMYMQGVFLQPDGVTPVAGTHSVTAAIYTNSPTAALTWTGNLIANNHGVAELVISDARLAGIFQTCTNATFQMAGPPEAFVTAPYAFQSANLPAASGNFTVQGDLNVASNARLVALTATNGGTLTCPITVGQFAIFTNVSSVNFGSGLDIAGGMTIGGTSEANYQVRFTNTAATAAFYGDTNSVVMSNAVVHAPFTLFSTNYAHMGANSGTAAEDGFLLVWANVSHWDNDGVNVKIGGNTFLLRYYANAGNGESLDFYTGNTFPVPRNTQWSATLADPGDSSHITISCYWVPLRGNG